MGDHNSKGPSTPEEGAPLHLPLDEVRRDRQRLRPIPTHYAGCVFRSRLEARWAVFLDALAIEWRYECEGFILAPFGDWYLPDFYLPELGYWIEVKPQKPDEEEQRKTYLFNYGLAREQDRTQSWERAFLLHGDIPWPYPKEGNIVGFSASHDVEGDPARRDLCWQACPLCQQITIGPINTMSCYGCQEELGMLVHEALDVIEGIPAFDKVTSIIPAMVYGALNTDFFRWGHKAAQLREAYAKARSTQFEGRRRRSA